MKPGQQEIVPGGGKLDAELPSTRIRLYQVRDEEEVRRIAADTAFFGEPVEAYLDDRDLFFDFFYAYYTRLEADHAWVAAVQGQVAGFLMGCPDTQRKGQVWARAELPALVRQLLLGRYQLGRKTAQYLRQVTRAYLSGDLPPVDLAVYPAHLHLNVAAGWRKLGLGSRLLENYLEQLRREGCPGLHLRTTSLNQAACRLYERAGFQLLAACPTRAWEDLVATPVENRLYGLIF